MKNYTTVSS